MWPYRNMLCAEQSIGIFKLLTQSLTRPGVSFKEDMVIEANYSTAHTHVTFNFLSFYLAQQPNSGLGRLILEVSRSHKIRHTQLVGIHWTSDQLVAGTATFDNTQHSQRQTSLPPGGFEPTIPAREQSQTHALDRAATGIGHPRYLDALNEWCLDARQSQLCVLKRFSNSLPRN
jgi:hypothetical protein